MKKKSQDMLAGFRAENKWGGKNNWAQNKANDKLWKVEDGKREKSSPCKDTWKNGPHLKSSLAVVILDFFIGSSEKENSCAAILNDSKEKEHAVSLVTPRSVRVNTENMHVHRERQHSWLTAFHVSVDKCEQITTSVGLTNSRCIKNIPANVRTEPKEWKNVILNNLITSKSWVHWYSCWLCLQIFDQTSHNSACVDHSLTQE